MSYVCTTQYEDYENWDWFQDYLHSVEREKIRISRQGPASHVVATPMSVSIGIQFGKWVIDTPEVRDIVYRRFVLGDYDNEAEGHLLSFASIHFMRKSNIKESNAFLAVCWRPIASILQGKLKSPDSDGYRKALLQASFAFIEDE